ncbi:hypothetical protein LCGC14_3159250, partial [marine sediment metagenome]
DNYKSVQVNLLKDKHKNLIEWLNSICEDEERSLNSVIIHIIKKEYNRCQKEK